MTNLTSLLVPLAPLFAALISPLPSCKNNWNFKFAKWIMVAGFITSITVLWQLVQDAEPINIVLGQTRWDVLTTVELKIDRLAAVMMLVISGFGSLLYHFSIRYLQQDSGQSRFQTLLAITVASLLLMVSSNDLISLFVFWQILSWFIVLLFHNYGHKQTAESSLRTFIILRGGDLMFLAGIVLAFKLYGTVEFSQLFEQAAHNQTSFNLLGTGLEISGNTAVTLLIFLGVMSKSGQFPFHPWLIDSLYGPTPLSALLHAGLINAGGFLLTRLAPLYMLSPTTLHIVLVIGLVTVILGKIMMLVQNDIKKTLAYSTIGQMGYMIMECGVGAFALAVFHLITHGLYKAEGFLSSGTVITEARENPYGPQPPTEKQRASIILAFVLSFLIPFFITTGVHELLGISFLEHQGLLILLLFSWITASQAMLTLFRLKKTIITKVAMLIAIGIITTIYFFAAEQFTHFLIPDHHLVEAYLNAAELPANLFPVLVGLLVLGMSTSWYFALYTKPHNEGGFREWLYLFSINKLYLDALYLRLGQFFQATAKLIDKSRALPVLAGLAGLILILTDSGGLSLASLLLLLGAMVLIPTFPLHRPYLMMLQHSPTSLTALLSLVAPVLGLDLLTQAIPHLTTEISGTIFVLACVGAIWASIKALMQVRVLSLLAYGGLALYSLFWCHISQTGFIDGPALCFVWTLTLTWTGLILAWNKVYSNYGDLTINNISGLVETMPKFALCFILLIMAGIGLPPFSNFFSYLGLLLSPKNISPLATVVIISTWLAACYYLFNLMKQLLFGPYRKDLHYRDIDLNELACFLVIISLLLIPSSYIESWLVEVIL